MTVFKIIKKQVQYLQFINSWDVVKFSTKWNLKEDGVKSVLVSMADKIHNTGSFLEDTIRKWESFTSHFGSSLQNKLCFREEVLKIGKEKLGKDHLLVIRLRLCTEELGYLAIMESY